MAEDIAKDLIEMRKERENTQVIQPPIQPQQLMTPAQAIEQAYAKPVEPMTTEQLIAKQQADFAKIKASNDAIEAELLRHERLKAQSYQAGKGFIHAPAAPPETPEEKYKREAKIRYAGTGLDPT